MRFEPLKPFKAQAELVIYKSSWGRWKFNAVFEATEPQVDDIITIQSPLQKTSSVSFRLTNHIKQHSPFQAFFTEGSAEEFGVQPKQGQLDPYGKSTVKMELTLLFHSYPLPMASPRIKFKIWILVI